MHERDGRPVNFDLCRPVHCVLHGDATQAQGLHVWALSTLSAVTGLVFLCNGLPDAPYDPDRPLVQRERYGGRYAPVLVAGF